MSTEAIQELRPEPDRRIDDIESRLKSGEILDSMTTLCEDIRYLIGRIKAADRVRYAERLERAYHYGDISSKDLFDELDELKKQGYGC